MKRTSIIRSADQVFCDESLTSTKASLNAGPIEIKFDSLVSVSGNVYRSVGGHFGDLFIKLDESEVCDHESYRRALKGLPPVEQAKNS